MKHANEPARLLGLADRDPLPSLPIEEIRPMDSNADPTNGAEGTRVQLVCRLETADRFVRLAPALLNFSLENRCSRRVHVLTWHTPLEGLFGPYLSLERSGQALDYRGPLASRFDPPREAYVGLAPGEVATGTVDLANAYDLSRPGAYTVRFGGRLWDIVLDPQVPPRPMSAHDPIHLDCPPTQFEIVVA